MIFLFVQPFNSSFISEFGHLTFFQYLAPELSIGETEPVSIHLNILTNKSNIRFLKRHNGKNLETEIIEALKSGKEEAFRYIYKTLLYRSLAG